MKKRIFVFDGSEGGAEMMVLILNHYAEVAFPLGGSDCAAASREAIQGIAYNIMHAESEGCDAEINRRQRPMLKSAVKWFFTQSEYAAPEDLMYNRLLSQFDRSF